jgi:oxygen-independent coproporphyrinogen-3 oxidase
MERPVTTVHWGGGTPGVLPPRWLEEVCARLRTGLRITDDTEWAIESPTRLLTPDCVESLLQAGFTRLHVGVQTLDDELRRAIGRQEDAATALRRLADLQKTSCVTTVDVVYGLPQQSRKSLLDTLAILVDMGIPGVSVYQFQQSARNRKFSRRYAEHACDPATAFGLLEACDNYLMSRGYRKNHFTHYALPPDENLYYTYPLRDEDLLGLGASADGVVGSYRYRYALLPDFLRAGQTASAFLGGADDPSLHHGDGRRFRAAIASGCIDAGCFPGWSALISDWFGSGYLRRYSENRYELTAIGVWHIAAMLSTVDTHERT